MLVLGQFTLLHCNVKLLSVSYIYHCRQVFAHHQVTSNNILRSRCICCTLSNNPLKKNLAEVFTTFHCNHQQLRSKTECSIFPLCFHGLLISHHQMLQFTLVCVRDLSWTCLIADDSFTPENNKSFMTPRAPEE